MEVTKIENVTRVYKIGEVETQGSTRGQPFDPKRRIYCRLLLPTPFMVMMPILKRRCPLVP